jgi:hypothetical protein
VSLGVLVIADSLSLCEGATVAGWGVDGDELSPVAPVGQDTHRPSVDELSQLTKYISYLESQG